MSGVLTAEQAHALPNGGSLHISRSAVTEGMGIRHLYPAIIVCRHSAALACERCSRRKLLYVLRRSATQPPDVGWLVPSSGGHDEAVVAPGPLSRVIPELVIGGASSDIRREAAAVIKAVWRLLEGQRSVEAQQVVLVTRRHSLQHRSTFSSPSYVHPHALRALQVRYSCL